MTRFFNIGSWSDKGVANVDIEKDFIDAGYFQGLFKACNFFNNTGTGNDGTFYGDPVNEGFKVARLLSYSYLYSVTDKGTNTYNYAGVSFRIPALDYRERGDRCLSFAGDRLFSKGKVDLDEEGLAWLTGALDIVRRDHPYSPLKVLVVAEEEVLALRRAEKVKDFVIEGMIITPDKVAIETQVRPNLRAELDGSVSILVEHAD